MHVTGVDKVKSYAVGSHWQVGGANPRFEQVKHWFGLSSQVSHWKEQSNEKRN